MQTRDREITEALFLADPPAPGVSAVVFGSSDPSLGRLRVERGVALWRAGLVPRLLLTGGATGSSPCPEASDMAGHARTLGVPVEALLCEDRSVNTFENARFSVALLRGAGLLSTPSTLLLVSSPWHLGRVVRTMRLHVPPGTRLLAIPSDERCGRASWAESPTCRRLVEAEAEILAAFVSAGLLPPE